MPHEGGSKRRSSPSGSPREVSCPKPRPSELLGGTYHPNRLSSGTSEVGLWWASWSLCIVPTTAAAARHPPLHALSNRDGGRWILLAISLRPWIDFKLSLFT